MYSNDLSAAGDHIPRQGGKRTRPRLQLRLRSLLLYRLLLPGRDLASLLNLTGQVPTRFSREQRTSSALKSMLSPEAEVRVMHSGACNEVDHTAELVD
jgi:hypothetical protein